MFQNSIVCISIFILSALFAWPLGGYMERVYKGRNNISDVLRPFENLVFKWCRVDPSKQMDWKQYLVAMLTINSVWLVYGLIILLFQGKLFLNPANNPSMDWALALNSTVSFLTSTNLQHYSGETGATYFSQVAVFMFLQFVSAATSLSAGVAVVRGLVAKTGIGLGNFYNDFLLSLTRILLPLCIIAAVVLLFSGVPNTFKGPQHIVTLQGDSNTVATGPVASFLPIKELGSNGGGFFGANDAHPFENPNFFTYVLHSVMVFLLPMAFIFFIGYYLQQKMFAIMVFGVMTVGFLMFTLPIILQETSGNANITAMGIHPGGNMEGKEVRFGPFYSAFYCGENVAIPAGTVVASHDSFMPLSGAYMLLAMNIDAFFGGLGTGWLNMFIFITITIFIGSLMIGRTPEIFGKKIGIREMQVTVGIVVLQSLVPLAMAAIACFVYSNFNGEKLQWLGNHGPHGFTTVLYEYISSSAGNGSGFEGLGDNTPFWNITTAIVMLTGRFVPIIGTVWVAGLLIEKQYVPPSMGTLKMQGVGFGLFLLVLILILNVLSLFPALMLGPISDNFMLRH